METEIYSIEKLCKRIQTQNLFVFYCFFTRQIQNSALCSTSKLFKDYVVECISYSNLDR